MAVVGEKLPVWRNEMAAQLEGVYEMRGTCDAAQLTKARSREAEAGKARRRALDTAFLCVR